MTTDLAEWPPMKKALWRVVTDSNLNTKYVNAWDLTEKLFAAAQDALPCTDLADERLREVVKWHKSPFNEYRDPDIAAALTELLELRALSRNPSPHEGGESAICATEGCDRPATGYFEAGGVGSHHCTPCLNAIRALSRPALPVEPVTEDACQRRGIYMASKVAHARRWRLLRDKVGYPIISTWIDEAGTGESQDLSDLWRRCIAEASSAEVLVINREYGEVLKGGWIELGAALSAGVPVLAVGIEDFTVAKDNRIRHFDSMTEVMAFLKPMINGVSFAALNPPKTVEQGEGR